jgi:hypothetical protein
MGKKHKHTKWEDLVKEDRKKGFNLTPEEAVDVALDSVDDLADEQTAPSEIFLQALSALGWKVTKIHE